MPVGNVKWFNNAKGFGFIVSEEHKEDLFAHFSSIQMEGYKTLKAGQPVEFDTVKSERGIHAVNIRLVDAESPVTETSPAFTEEPTQA
ncbi:cold shock domain-containing protein [Reinekea marinisedimentorum]|uniref:CspA family cold shock protein n=1 Tax=Reinekea marinisedimentorum TaxID=230495 RepID=A0A4R3IAG7_9GAMM|nr:cold shock domain-containing protein [Reinekea marinisedimentorum]TCS42479.1 CspA family cold shock protein [Reinekea marinisedimentorum]